jgi:retinol-binding protein 3
MERMKLFGRTLRSMGTVASVSLFLLPAAFAQGEPGRDGASAKSPSKPSALGATPAKSADTLTLDAAARAAIVEKINAILEEYYFDPGLAAKMKARLNEQMRAGAYDSITAGDKFAALLNRDLKSVSNDLHLGVMFHPQPQPTTPEEKMTEAELDARDAQMRRFFETLNYGVPKVEVLPGNIGYIELKGFPHPDWAGETIANTFDLLSNTKALIIDMRQNAGGYPSTVALWTSYLYAPRSIHGATDDTHLFDQYDHRTRTTKQFWTAPYVRGKRYLNKPVYLLIGNMTFSGGEIFADAVKALKRGTLIGGRTAGGSNSVLTRPINTHFEMGVSFGNTINAITKTSLEGSGVAPDVEAPRLAARETAYLMALRQRAERESDPGEKGRLMPLITKAESDLKAAMPRPSLTGNTEFRLKGHANAKAVYLAGFFNRWDGTALPMTREGDTWVARIDLPPGRHAYKFMVDGTWMMDPDNGNREIDFMGNENSIKMVAPAAAAKTP